MFTVGTPDGTLDGDGNRFWNATDACCDFEGRGVDDVAYLTAVIADITQINENVMYEVGYAHGRGLRPLIYTRNVARLDNLPVYFRTLNVRLASDETPLSKLIDDYLLSVKDTRRPQQPAT